MEAMTFETMPLPTQSGETAPDGSIIRPLVRTARGSLSHCTLPPGAVTIPVAHHTIEEIWYFLSGRGQVWRRQGDRQEVVDVSPGVSLTIPTGTHFQFRSTGPGPLVFVILTMPPWPGDGEAYRVGGFWERPED
jgi:mannose-6-phosphate isomerase-like protein (cupin superfamily)